MFGWEIPKAVTISYLVLDNPTDGKLLVGAMRLECEGRGSKKDERKVKMEKEKVTEVVTFRCTRETYCLLQELAAAKGWTVSHYCHRVISDLVKQYRFLVYQGGGEQDG